MPKHATQRGKKRKTHRDPPLSSLGSLRSLLPSSEVAAVSEAPCPKSVAKSNILSCNIKTQAKLEEKKCVCVSCGWYVLWCDVCVCVLCDVCAMVRKTSTLKPSQAKRSRSAQFTQTPVLPMQGSNLKCWCVSAPRGSHLPTCRSRCKAVEARQVCRRQHKNLVMCRRRTAL